MIILITKWVIFYASRKVEDALGAEGYSLEIYDPNRFWNFSINFSNIFVLRCTKDPGKLRFHVTGEKSKYYTRFAIS